MTYAVSHVICTHALHDRHNVIPKRRSGGRGSTPTQGGSTLCDLIPRGKMRKKMNLTKTITTLSLMRCSSNCQEKMFTKAKKKLAGRSQSVTPIYRCIYMVIFPDEG